jgi:hypothetical protein
MQAYWNDSIKRELQGVDWISFTQERLSLAVINIRVQHDTGVY